MSTTPFEIVSIRKKVSRRRPLETQDVNPLSPPDESGLCKSRDSVDVYYEVRGKGRPLLLCYGLTCRIEHWHHQIEILSKDYQVITMDYRGHHRSGLPENERNMTVLWCARDVEAVLKHLNVEEVVCLGHSFGVPILAYLSPWLGEKMRGAVFVCGSAGAPFQHMFHSDRLRPVFELSSKLYRWTPRLVTRTWYEFTKRNWLTYFVIARFGFNPALSNRKDIVGYLEGVHDASFDTFHRLLKDYESLDSEKLLRSMSCPTLIMAGDSDFITPLDVQQEMLSYLSQGELFVIPKGSHNAHMDCPETVNQEILKFLKRIEYQ